MLRSGPYTDEGVSSSMTSSRKPEGDQPLSHPRRDPPRLEVEPLVLRHRANCGGMAAAHVVVLDLEVRHRVGVRPFVEHQVAVGLKGVGAPGALLDPV